MDLIMSEWSPPSITTAGAFSIMIDDNANHIIRTFKSARSKQRNYGYIIVRTDRYLDKPDRCFAEVYVSLRWRIVSSSMPSYWDSLVCRSSSARAFIVTLIKARMRSTGDLRP